MNFFTIKDLENLSGIKAHTIRMWEQRYGFLKPRRTNSNIRYYDGQELKKLLNVAVLNRAGFRISQINEMSEEERKSKLLSLSMPYACQERTVSALLAAVTDMDTERFEEILDKCIADKGFAKTATLVVFPFLEKIGQLWSTSRMLTAQEHLVTHLIRLKFVLAIENARSRIKRETSFLLLLPEGEWHELGLLFVWYLLRSRGFQVLYLGPNMPVPEAAELCGCARVDYLYLHLTSVTGNFRWSHLVKDLVTCFPGKQVIIAGPMAAHAKPGRLPDNITIKPRMDDVVSFLNAC